MSSTSSVSTSSSVSTGNAQDVSSLSSSSYSLSLASAVTVKVQPYLDRADAIATEINTNQTKIASYQNMQTLLQSLETATSNLSTQATEGTNVFTSRTANLTSSSVLSGSSPTDASTLMSVSVATGTATGKHTVIVNKLAASEEDVSNTIDKSTSAALGYTGSFSITESGKTAVSISVTSTMSVTDIASAINSSTTQTGVSASVVSIDSSHSVLVINGSDEDTALSFSDTGGVLADLGVYSGETSLTGTTTETDSTSALGLAGSFTINGGTDSSGTATAVSVTVTSSMSLTDIVDAINTAATTAGVQGTLASVASNQLSISSGGTGVVGFSSVTGDVLSGLGISEVASNGAANQVKASQAADLTVDGVTGITRSTNTISDVMTGITLDLTAADANTEVTLTVAPDTTGTATAIESFVSAYNSWESFVTANEATDSSGGASSSAILFGDSTLREVSLKLDTSITSMINNLSLSDFGITLDSSNQLSVDTTTLSTELKTNFSDIKSLFQSQVTSSNSALQPSGTDYSSYAGSFVLGVTTNTSGAITGVTLNGAATTAFTYSGTTISGASSGAYSGMYFSFSGAAGTTTTATMTATTGLANQIYTNSKNYGNTTNGTVESLITSMQDQDSTLTTQYNSIISEANTYTTFLTNQYANLTTQIESASYSKTVLNEMFAMETS